MNSYDQLQLLRDYVQEATAAHWSDVNLLRRLNVSQSKIALIVAMSPGSWLLASASVTPVASIITLPADCAKPIYLEETSSGYPLMWLDGGVQYRRVSRQIGTTLGTGSAEAYVLSNTIEVNQTSYSTVCTLWYQIRVPNLHTGTAAAGAATSLTLTDDRNAKRIADYYNGVDIEIISGTGTAAVDTITDYTAARVCAVSGTYDATTVYGTISKLPEETHDLIVLEATALALMKPGSKLDKEVIQYYMTELRATRKVVNEWLETRPAANTGVAIGDPY